MKKTQVFFWVGEVRPGREDEKRPGRPPTASLDEILAYRLERDSYTTACRLTASMGISPHMVIAMLHKALGMKCFHLRWVPHTLIDPQKANKIRSAQEMTWALDNHSRTGFKDPWTGDESWMIYDLCYYTVKELQEAITSTIEGIPKTKLIQVFQTWRQRLATCI
jgi:hypothetical protein